MSCPDIETLISFALSSNEGGYEEIAEHVLHCDECKRNLEIIHETMLAKKWDVPPDENKSDEPGREKTAKSDQDVASNQDSRIQECLKIADKDMRDRFGVMSIPRGAQYLEDPNTGECELAKPDVLNLFTENGYSFYCLGYETAIQKSISLVRKYLGEIDLNINGLKGCLIPNCNLSWKENLKPWALRYKYVEKHGLSQKEHISWIKSLESRGILPVTSTQTERMKSRIHASNQFCVYDIGRKDIKFRIFVAFVTPVSASMAGNIAKNDVIQCVRNFAAVWERNNNPGEVQCRCYTICAANGWEDNVKASVSSDEIVVISQPDKAARTGWKIISPLVENMREAFKTLIIALYPQSLTTQQNLIQPWLFDRRFRFENRFKASDVSEEFGIPKLRVLEVFEILRQDKAQSWRADEDGISIYWDDKGVKGRAFEVQHMRMHDIWISLAIASLTTVTTLVGFLVKWLAGTLPIPQGFGWCIYGLILVVVPLLVFFLIELIKNQVRRRLYY